MNRHRARSRAAVGAVLLLVGACLAWVAVGDRFGVGRTSAPGSSSSPATSMPGFGARAPLETPPERSPVRAPPKFDRSSAALGVLHGWDKKRASVYARGDVDALSRLYVPGTRARALDVALLERYLRRGLRVEGLQMQLLAVRVLSHDQGYWKLRVTDRVMGAVTSRAGKPVILPRDLASTRVVALRRTPAKVWQVSSVR